MSRAVVVAEGRAGTARAPLIRLAGYEKVFQTRSVSHRLSTPLNAYAGWWSEWVMRQIQGSILVVIRNRCESR